MSKEMKSDLPEIKKLGNKIINKAAIDVPVLVLFFNRPIQTAQVFEQIKIARPSILFLYQDGARDSVASDKDNVQKCRDIVEDIDWECTVYRQYLDFNQGCDPSEYLSQKWAFEYVDRCIIFEDDDVPSQSFFPFCKEILERYKDDERVGMICGTNRYITEGKCENSYFFSKGGWEWGWATWKRFYDNVPDSYNFLNDTVFMRRMEDFLDNYNNQGDAKFKNFIKRSRICEASGRLHYEILVSAAFYSYHQYSVIPNWNMITNIGIGVEGAHNSLTLEKLPRRERENFGTKRYEIEFPLKHPEKFEIDIEMSRGIEITKFQYFCDRIESIYLKLKFGDFKGLKRAILRRLFPQKYI